VSNPCLPPPFFSDFGLHQLHRLRQRIVGAIEHERLHGAFTGRCNARTQGYETEQRRCVLNC